jgi:hypothetical protein
MGGEDSSVPSVFLIKVVNNTNHRSQEGTYVRA